MPSTKSAVSRLTPRLLAVAGFVPEGGRLIDIGTDHALLPVARVASGKNPSALAVDIRPGPLDAARRNIAAAGLADRIGTRLADGLDGLDLTPEDTVVMAGLGGYEMMHILGGQPRICRAVVLQPMKSVPELRRWLGANGYAIVDETLAVEKPRAYPILLCNYDGLTRRIGELDAWVGPVLLQKQPVGFSLYLERLLKSLQKRLRGAPELIDLYNAVSRLNADLQGGQPMEGAIEHA